MSNVKNHLDEAIVRISRGAECGIGASLDPDECNAILSEMEQLSLQIIKLHNLKNEKNG